MSGGGNLSAAQQAEALISASYAGKEYQWQGKLVRTEAEIDASSRMLYGVVQVESIQSKELPPLMVGLFVQAQISGRRVEDVIIVPRVALRENNQVLVLDDDNSLHFRKVNVLRIQRNNVLINQGLKSGDKVCVSSLPFAVDGIKVNPVMVQPL